VLFARDTFPYYVRYFFSLQNTFKVTENMYLEFKV
jgi:hypothetical protein